METNLRGSQALEWHRTLSLRTTDMSKMPQGQPKKTRGLGRPAVVLVVCAESAPMRSEEAFMTHMGNDAGAGSLAAGERVKAKGELKRPMMTPFRCSEALEMDDG
jgi:hypothetical protein